MNTNDILANIQGIVSENTALKSENAELRSQLDAIRTAMSISAPAPARKASRKTKTVKTSTPEPVDVVDVKVLRDMGGTIGHTADGMAYAVTYDRTWTWVYFQSKPAREVLDLLGRKGMGGRFTPKRGPSGGWGFDRLIQTSEFTAIIGG